MLRVSNWATTATNVVSSAIIEKYKLSDPALLELAKIVRAADTEKFELAPESIGLEAIASGSMMLAKDDYEAIEKQSYVYDSLYAYCKLRLVKQKYAKEIEKLEPKQRRDFLRGKVMILKHEPNLKW